MSRVFVSCSLRDRAVGAQLASIVRALGHEPSDDQDESQGTAWWNEVVGRIEASDVFVAVASPAYAEAPACRLAAKHAAASGMPVVRVDLDEKAVPDCHPVVAAAVGVPFAPEDPEAVVRLAQALTGSPPEVPTDTTAPADPPPSDDPDSYSLLEVSAVVAVMLIAAGLLYLGLSNNGPSKPSTVATTATTSAQPTPTGTSTPDAGLPTSDAAIATVLVKVENVDSPRLPASSCQAGAEAVTCSNPAPNLRTVVLTPYSTPSKLYAAYTAEVEELSGGSLTENTGNCSPTESEGELGWNLDKEHTLDFSISQQAGGDLDPVSESAGRVFCTETQQVMTLVWTQDPGLLVTVTGQPSEMVVTWWSDVHLELACGGDQVGSGC